MGDLKEKIFTLVLAFVFLTFYITHTSVEKLSPLKLLFIPTIFFLAYLFDCKLGKDNTNYKHIEKSPLIGVYGSIGGLFGFL
ncbi:hypothetical protein [Priestia megaterium]|uniref:hypothetical protein n=1 Tax=Priestia megaterium TaxID=1404 RepID=UPI0027AA9C33|nr:hypothetical protein [Priestia megaterium]MEB4887648.1 hypothetical protein [Priestia megaterium]WDC91269.1 hypothetical protein PSR56_27390 [Priestia megaterium]